MNIVGKMQDRLKDCKKCFGVAYCSVGDHSHSAAEVEAIHDEMTCQVG